MRLLDQARELVYRKITVLYCMMLSCPILGCAVLLSTGLDQCCVVSGVLATTPGFQTLGSSPLCLPRTHMHTHTVCTNKHGSHVHSKAVSLSLSLQSVSPRLCTSSQNTPECSPSLYPFVAMFPLSQFLTLHHSCRRAVSGRRAADVGLLSPSPAVSGRGGAARQVTATVSGGP